MALQVIFNLDFDRSEPYKPPTVDASSLWRGTPLHKRRGWLRQHKLREDHAQKIWDDLPLYVQQRWEAESEG